MNAFGYEKKESSSSRSEITEVDGTKKVSEVNHSNSAGLLDSLVGTLGASGIIAVLVISTACAIAIIQVVRGTPVEMPKFLYEFSILILGFYFGQRSSTRRSQSRDASSKPPVGFCRQKE